MELLSTLLTIVYVFSCLFLGFVVLIQKGEGGGLGGAFGGGAVDVAFGAKADMTWKRATAVASTLFMLLAIIIGILDQQIQQRSVVDQAREVQEQQEEAKEEGKSEGSLDESISNPGVNDNQDGTDQGSDSSGSSETPQEPEAPETPEEK